MDDNHRMEPTWLRNPWFLWLFWITKANEDLVVMTANDENSNMMEGSDFTNILFSDERSGVDDKSITT